MKYIGFTNTQGDTLELYQNTNRKLCITIKYAGGTEAHPFEVESDDIEDLIIAIEDMKEYIERKKHK